MGDTSVTGRRPLPTPPGWDAAWGAMVALARAEVRGATIPLQQYGLDVTMVVGPLDHDELVELQAELDAEDEIESLAAHPPKRQVAWLAEHRGLDVSARPADVIASMHRLTGGRIAHDGHGEITFVGVDATGLPRRLTPGRLRHVLRELRVERRVGSVSIAD